MSYSIKMALLCKIQVTKFRIILDLGTLYTPYISLLEYAYVLIKTLKGHFSLIFMC